VYDALDCPQQKCLLISAQTSKPQTLAA
jgi:hypothetical protein